MPSLLQLPGVGPIVAGVSLPETRDPKRFASPHHFASYCGAAPVERGSGQNRRMQINPGGNRRLSWALHIVAMVRLRMNDGRSKEFLERAQLRGKTKRSGLRLLKTYIARELFRVLSRGHRQSLLAEADTALTLAEADDELLNGGGPAAGELTGIVAIVPAYDTAADVTGDTGLDTLSHAILQLQAKGVNPIAAVVTPAAAESLRLTKSSTGEYIGGFPTSSGDPWGFQIVPDANLTGVDFLVGN
jgi:Transposase IS116/IS110/IS902 family/Phage capsid family